ncbi:GyrI-like domain-containing protein [Serratia fonticola]|nr:GyrI-like domain-containing protein [Serratia fonticola]MBC3227933.1 GyrI-like domain-containing protein [Serratia fonticola]
MFNVNITKLVPMRIIGLPHTGPYGEINRTFTELYQLVTSRQLFRPGILGVAIYYDDPDVTPVEKLRAFAAISAPTDVTAETPLVEQFTPGGDHGRILDCTMHINGCSRRGCWSLGVQWEMPLLTRSISTILPTRHHLTY